MSEVTATEGFRRFARYYEPQWKFRKWLQEYALETKLVGAQEDLVLNFTPNNSGPLVYVEYMIREQTSAQTNELIVMYRVNRRLCAQYGVQLTRHRLKDGRGYVRIERSLPKRFWQNPFELNRILQSFLEYLERFMPMYQSVWDIPGQGERIGLWANRGSRMVH